MTWNAPRTWSPGETVTADMLNEQVRDNELSLAAWTAYTPIFTASSSNPSIGNGAISGAYARAGDLLIVRISLEWGTTTTEGTGAWQFSLPFDSAEPAGAPLGRAINVQASGDPGAMYDVVTQAGHPERVVLFSGSTIVQDSNITVSVGGRLAMKLTYEANT